MKEIYEKMQIDIEIMSVLDVITTSSDVEGTDPTESEEHENAYSFYGGLSDEGPDDEDIFDPDVEPQEEALSV